MVSRAIISGLMSAGINVQNLEATAIPITRTMMTTMIDVSGGIHVRLEPNRADYLLIEFFDKQGITISKSQEKKIEGAYFKEDLRRVSIQEIGNVSYPSGVLDIYSRAFARYLNIAAVRSSSSKIVIDYVYAVAGAILPQLLAKFGCDAVVLNASLQEMAITVTQKEVLLIN